MAMTEKIKVLLVKKGMTASQLAEKMNTSQPNLSKKMKRDNFSEKELVQIAEVLDVEFEGFFFLGNGEKV